MSPSIREASGHGSKRLWSYLDVVRVALISHLEDYGLSVAKLREIGEGMKRDDRMQANCILLVPPKGSEDIEILHNFEVLEGDDGFRRPFSPSAIPPSAFSKALPVQMVASMNFLHQWVHDRISKIGLE